MTTANKITILRMILVPVLVILMYLDFHYNQVSNFGKFMDPLADKLLVIAAMMVFVEQGYMPGWALLIVVARELAVTGLRLVAVDNGRVIAAAWSGKIKTASTMIGIIAMMLIGIPHEVRWLNTVVWIIIVLTTVYSGAEYFYKNRDVLKMD